VNDALHADGSIGYMQSSGSKPADGQPLSYSKIPDFEDFGLGGFLLAGSEVYRLIGNTKTTTGVVTMHNEKCNLTAYPNPFSACIQINCSTKSVNPALAIMDAAGRQVYNFETEIKRGDNLVWNGKTLSGTLLCNGLYFISLQDGNQQQSLKIMLMR